MQQVFWTNTLPNHWIAKGDDGQWYMWPASGSWGDKRPYHGHTAGLQRADEATTRMVCREANNVSARILTGDMIWICNDA